MRYLSKLENGIIRWALVVILLFFIAALDIVSGYYLHFFVFYFVPVAIIAWWGGKTEVLFVACLSTVIWFLSDNLSGNEYPASFYQYWNGSMRLTAFLAIGFSILAMQRSQFQQRKLALELQKTLDVVQQLANTDALTLLSNQRIFYERLDQEMARSKRHEHPFTIAYIDLDNFKQVNDTFGHDQGDELLRIVADCLRDNSRETDVVARLGGDEFGIMLPETTGDNARVVLDKIRDNLLVAMQKKNWPVTCSIGAVTFLQVPDNVQEAIKQADNLMYTVKKSGKNAIAQESWPGA